VADEALYPSLEPGIGVVVEDSRRGYGHTTGCSSSGAPASSSMSSAAMFLRTIVCAVEGFGWRERRWDGRMGGY
jgi:hypothetical protein